MDMSSTIEDGGGSIVVVGSEVEFRYRAVETELPEKQEIVLKVGRRHQESLCVCSLFVFRPPSL